MGSLGELQFSSKGEAIDGDSALGWRSEKPEAWPTDGPDCEADHLASYGVLNTMDLVRKANKFNVQCELNPTQRVNSIQSPMSKSDALLISSLTQGLARDLESEELRE